jgi:hypothetical protein
MFDLFAIARGNALVIEERFEVVVAGMGAQEAALAREFASWVETEALISINVPSFVVGELLAGRACQNTYELAGELAAVSGRPAEDILRERLKDHYERRIAFDGAFNGGQNFRYGALNAGGPGLTQQYDPYCVVLKRTYQDTLTDLAYLPGDSLKICFGGAGASLDEDAVRRSPAPHSHRHVLVAIERAAEVPTSDKHEWPKLVAPEGRYFEVIFVGEVLLEAVECVRALKTEIKRMRELEFANFGRKLDPGERALADDFVVLRRGALEGKLRLEEV